jgi:hypothetical protein
MRAIIASVMLGCLVVTAAEASQHEADPSTAPALSTAVRTGKERLGEKATDEQRVDDCNVPSGRRTWERPTACPWDIETQAAVTGDQTGTVPTRHSQAQPDR